MRAHAPILFDDHDPEAPEAQRSSPVDPAGRSPTARRKARRKQADSGLAIHSFRRVIDQLGNLAASTMELIESGATLQLRTRLTPLQQRCFDLLEVKLKKVASIPHPADNPMSLPIHHLYSQRPETS
ncbi:MAG: hypothetical protein OXI33_17485 [Chloroflexota bacterium]|nr:hypothetical protein [Chloroflexota bacterium]